MITLQESFDRAPVTIYYLGTEKEFLAKVEPLGEIRNADKINVEFVASEGALIDALCGIEPTSLVVFGLVSYMNARKSQQTRDTTRVFTDLSNLAHQITYGDDAKPNEVLEQLISRAELINQDKN